jgi:hypothetical protein
MQSLKRKKRYILPLKVLMAKIEEYHVVILNKAVIKYEWMIVLNSTIYVLIKLAVFTENIDKRCQSKY